MTDTLDPESWPEFRQNAHKMLEAALDKMQAASHGPVWQPLPDQIKQQLQMPLPRQGAGSRAMQQQIEALLPYGVGNTHPRFFGWVHGAGSTSGMISEIAAAAMNANLGGRDHGAIYVEKQVVDWVRQMFGFPDAASGFGGVGHLNGDGDCAQGGAGSGVGNGNPRGRRWSASAGGLCVKSGAQLRGAGL